MTLTLKQFVHDVRKMSQSRFAEIEKGAPLYDLNEHGDPVQVGDIAPRDVTLADRIVVPVTCAIEIAYYIVAAAYCRRYGHDAEIVDEGGADSPPKEW